MALPAVPSLAGCPWSFLRQLGWELHRLVRRPRSGLGFAVCLAFEATMLGLQQVPAVRAAIVQHFWRVRLPIDAGAAFSGMATAVEIVGETSVWSMVLFLTLVGGDVVAKEAEDGTLAMVLSRPIARTSVVAQKLVVCLLYTAALVAFVFATTLVMALACEGTGRFLILVPRDNLLGMLDFAVALRRYALAVPILAASMVTVTLLAFALSCFPLKPATAATLALAVLFADWAVHIAPSFVALTPYCLTTRLGTWRQVFNDAIPWLRIQRNLRDLLWIDLGLVTVAWAAFVRREPMRR